MSSTCHRNLKPIIATVLALSFICLPGRVTPASAPIYAGDTEFTGTLESVLIAKDDDMDQVVMRPFRDLSKVKFASPPDADAKVVAGRLYHPPSDKFSILTLMVEPAGGSPYLLADIDSNNSFSADEKLALSTEEDGNPYILKATIKVPVTIAPFTYFPVVVNFFKGVDWDGLKSGEQLLLQSTAAFARGYVDINGKKTLVQFGFNAASKKINPTNGWVGIDCDGDGEIDMDRISPEAAEARDESVVFRVGEVYVSAKRVDLEKNQVILRSHAASDYKRVELRVGGELPDFQFTDFNGKKRRFSEFRGKYVLMDFWGSWCPPCRRELPYLKAAYSRFQARGFEILGMDNDEDMAAVKAWLERNNLTWTQARTESIREIFRTFRIHTFPTTILVGPDGKIISLNQRKKNQPELRGAALLKSLDELLPP